MHTIQYEGQEFSLMECPFCGRNPAISRTGLTWTISCSGRCSMRMQAGSPSMLQLQWNTRDNGTAQVSLTRPQFELMTRVFRENHAEEVMFNRATMEVYDTATKAERHTTIIGTKVDDVRPVIALTRRRQVNIRRET